MTLRTDEDIARVAEGLLNCSLPKPEWTHEAHFAAALWFLNTSKMDVFADMPDIIRRYNEICGVPNTDDDGYHETITLASLKAARHFLSRASPAQKLCETLFEMLAAGYDRSDWLLEYWSYDCLFSVTSRRRWVEPNMKALPFT